MKTWIAYIGLGMTMVQAETRKEAVAKLLEETGFKNKPWIARDWNVRPATEAEIADYASRVIGQNRSQPVARQVNRRTAADIAAKLL